MIALFVRSAWEILTNTGPGFMDSLSGLVFFLLVGKWYQSKTYDALSFERDYKSYFPVSATLIDEDGKEQIIPIKILKAGHRILIRNQEVIPADAYLVSGEGQIDYSFVSGESSPVEKRNGDKVFAGGRQLGGAIEVIVEKEVMQSYLTDLWNKKLNSKTMVSTMTRLMDKLGHNFTIAIIIISVGTAIAWAFIDPSVIMNAFTSVLIVACPCALALTVPFAFGNTMRIFGRKGFYLKQAEVVESISKTDTIVFDKTGTLTRNDLYEISFANLQADPETLTAIRSLVRQSTHPVSNTIYRSLEQYEIKEVSGFEEVVSKGISGRVNGKEYKLGSAGHTGTSHDSSDAGGNLVFVSQDGISLGYILLSNKYRDGILDVIGSLKANYELHVLSGDNNAERAALEAIFGDTAKLHFFQSPHDKLNYIKQLKQEGKHVLMVGDGLNDAGALQFADTGISIADEVYHFSPACDAILDSAQFDKLAGFIRFTKTSVKVVKSSIFISLAYNITGVTIAAMGLLTPVIAAILMPLSSVSVVVFNTVSVRLAAKKKL
jgi:Cu+-exporting ATPase